MLSIVVPTYRREQVLLNTIEMLLQLSDRASEILIIDQTEKHAQETNVRLSAWNRKGEIRWIRLEQPSIANAMNIGLQRAREPLVLFLDDDIEPTSSLVSKHAESHQKDPRLWATVGQVIQPWQKSELIPPPRKLKGLRVDWDFPFHSTVEADIQNVMAGNLCVHRERAMWIGGFDENFQGAAYRFETEFAKRIDKAGGHIRFLGSASLKHLRIREGGTRSEGSHLTSMSPKHGVGDHYYAFRHGRRCEAWGYSIRRVFREVSTRFHLTHPWWIPIKFIGELRAMFWGWRLSRKPASLLQQERPC